MRNAIASILLLLSLVVAPFVLAQEVDNKQRREQFAAQVIGVNFAFLEAQRAGQEPSDGRTLFPEVWASSGSTRGFKTTAFGRQCDSVPSVHGDTTALRSWGGYFEAGTSVTVTGTAAFVAVQRAIGAMHFMDQMETAVASSAPVRNPDERDGCLVGSFANTSLKDLYLRELRFSARSLAASILKSSADNSEFTILVGTADSSTFNSITTWGAPYEYSQKCYLGDEEKPAADIAAQVAAALALSAKVARDHGTPQDAALANQWEALAKRAYIYAKSQYGVLFGAATCSKNTQTRTNCLGVGCGSGRGTCALYDNTKDARQQLFVAASALYVSTSGGATEAAQYRIEADDYWSDSFEPFFFNWNNVAPQGVILLAGAGNVNGARRNKRFYEDVLLKGIKQWETCSNDGENQFGDGKVFCRRSRDGAAHPLDIPQGQLGQGLNAVCMAAVANKLGLLTSTFKRDATCFMQRQLGYTFNHKCADIAGNTGSCNTDDSEGFSYVVGIGKHYPSQLHSRDSSEGVWGTSQPDTNRLCGAAVTGPYVGWGNTDPDRYYDSRGRWKESEPGIDFTASLLCGMMGYASLPENSFERCRVRTPFTGRFPRTANPPPGTPVALPPVRDPIGGDDEECAAMFRQCGGRNWAGAECCVDGAVCVRQDQWYSDCQPEESVNNPPPENPPPTDPTPNTPPPNTTPDDGPCEGSAPAYGQCGGFNFNDGVPMCCPQGFSCTETGVGYFGCEEDPEVPPPPPDTQGCVGEAVQDEQCGGLDEDGFPFNGGRQLCCVEGTVCTFINLQHSGCLPDPDAIPPPPVNPPPVNPPPANPPPANPPPVTPPPANPPPVNPPPATPPPAGPCEGEAGPYEQCGGMGFNSGRELCCATGFRCAGTDSWKGCQVDPDAAPPPPSGTCVGEAEPYGKCKGVGFNGGQEMCCPGGQTCVFQNAWYSGCQAA